MLTSNLKYIQGYDKLYSMYKNEKRQGPFLSIIKFYPLVHKFFIFRVKSTPLSITES